MAWHDECPHKVYASALLLDGKIEGWKTGNPPKKEPGEFRAYWKRDRMNDYTVEYVGFEVNNDREHDDAFRKLAPEWFRQWPLAEDLHGSPPYSDVPEGVVGTRDEILAMVPGPEMDALVAEKIMGLNVTSKFCFDSKEGTEICLWEDGPYLHGCDYLDLNKTNKGCPEYCSHDPLNYSTDISAAWEMEEEAYRNNGEYTRLLAKITQSEVLPYWINQFRLLHATPEQRCKAALLAKEVPE